MTKSQKALALALGLQGILLGAGVGLTVGFGFQVPLSRLNGSRNDLVISVLLLFIVLIGMDVCLYLIQTERSREPWRYQWTLMKLIFELSTGWLSLSFGHLAGMIVLYASAADHAVGLAGQRFMLAVFIALVILLTIIPAHSYWTTARQFGELRKLETLLTRLGDRYDEHLSRLLPDPQRQFPIEVILDPGAGDVSAESGGKRSASNQVRGSPTIQTPQTTQEQVRRAFQSGHGRLLLLAESGGGKSTQLYLLARDLIAEAQVALADIRQAVAETGTPPDYSRLRRVPILIDATLVDDSPGATDAHPFESSLLKSVIRDYDVQRADATRWVSANRYVFLLDSLEALDEAKQRRCVETINHFLHDQPEEPLVVSYGRAEYAALRDLRVDLQQTATMFLLSEDAVQSELTLPGVDTRLQHDARDYADLRQTLRVPMRLSQAIASAEHWTPTEHASGLPMRWDRAIFRAYVEHVLQRHPAGDKRQAETFLSWLGLKLKQRHKVIFHLEDLQRDWLPTLVDEQWYKRRVGRAKLGIKLAVGLTFGVTIAGAVSAAYQFDEGALGAIFATGSDTGFGPVARLIVGIIGGLGVGLGVGQAIHASRNIAMMDRLKPELRVRRQPFVVATLIGSLAAGATVLIASTIVGWGGVLLVGGAEGAIVGTVVGLGDRLPVAPEQFPRPSRGYRNAVVSAVRTAAMIALAGALAAGMIVAILFEQIVGGGHGTGVILLIALVVGLAISLSILTFFGLEAALRNGGASALQHRILRGALVSSQAVPRHFERFLEELRADGLLRREGHGYTFLLRSALLRDDFADDYNRAWGDCDAPSQISPRSRV